jgi:hypothetical protein
MNMGALGRFEASLEARKSPRCAACGSANPQGAPKCPTCGASIEVVSEVRLTRDVALTGGKDRLFPWHAKALLAIGAGLKRLARQLKGE